MRQRFNDIKSETFACAIVHSKFNRNLGILDTQ